MVHDVEPDEDAGGAEQPHERFELLRPVEVQRMLKVSRSWLYHAAREGLLPSLRLGPDGPVRFIRADVEEFVDAARAKWQVGDTREEALRRAAEPSPTGTPTHDQHRKR
jgi:predicted DNA-binding transcriptional regulator AlpA